MDAVLIGTIYLQGAVAADEQLPLAVDGCLVVGRGSVLHFVSAVHNKIGIALALDVDGCSRGTGDIRPVKVQFKIGVTVNDKRTIGRLSGHHIAYSLRAAVVGSHIVAVDGNGHTLNGWVFRIRHIDIDQCGEGIGTGGITIGRVLCCGCRLRFRRSLVYGDGEGFHLRIG